MFYEKAFEFWAVMGRMPFLSVDLRVALSGVFRLDVWKLLVMGLSLAMPPSDFLFMLCESRMAVLLPVALCSAPPTK